MDVSCCDTSTPSAEWRASSKLLHATKPAGKSAVTGSVDNTIAQAIPTMGRQGLGVTMADMFVIPSARRHSTGRRPATLANAFNAIVYAATDAYKINTRTHATRGPLLPRGSARPTARPNHRRASTCQARGGLRHTRDRWCGTSLNTIPTRRTSQRGDCHAESNTCKQRAVSATAGRVSWLAKPWQYTVRRRRSSQPNVGTRPGNWPSPNCTR